LHMDVHGFQLLLDVCFVHAFAQLFQKQEHTSILREWEGVKTHIRCQREVAGRQYWPWSHWQSRALTLGTRLSFGPRACLTTRANPFQDFSVLVTPYTYPGLSLRHSPGELLFCPLGCLREWCQQARDSRHWEPWETCASVLLPSKQHVLRVWR
jgi:hypothetical protein